MDAEGDGEERAGGTSLGIAAGFSEAGAGVGEGANGVRGLGGAGGTGFVGDDSDGARRRVGGHEGVPGVGSVRRLHEEIRLAGEADAEAGIVTEATDGEADTATDDDGGRGGSEGGAARGLDQGGFGGAGWEFEITSFKILTAAAGDDEFVI